jgi:hypothetical protein
MLQIILSTEEAEELKSAFVGSELASKIEAAEVEAKDRAARAAEAKKAQRARATSNRKARMQQLKEAAAELARIKAGEGR